MRQVGPCRVLNLPLGGVRSVRTAACRNPTYWLQTLLNFTYGHITEGHRFPFEQRS